MNPEDIKMGEWYRCGAQQRGEEFTPLSLHCDSFAEMAFRERKSGAIYLFPVSEMEPVPKPVGYPEAWITIDRERNYWSVFGSLAAATAGFVSMREHVIGILHVRTDGTTEMLEIES